MSSETEPGFDFRDIDTADEMVWAYQEWQREQGQKVENPVPRPSSLRRKLPKPRDPGPAAGTYPYRQLVSDTAKNHQRDAALVEWNRSQAAEASKWQQRQQEFEVHQIDLNKVERQMSPASELNRWIPSALSDEERRRVERLIVDLGVTERADVEWISALVRAGAMKNPAIRYLWDRTEGRRRRGPDTRYYGS